MNGYIDTSALVKAVLDEPEADVFVEAWERLDDAYASSVGYLELRSAMARARLGGRGLGPDDDVDRYVADKLWEEVVEIDLDGEVLGEAVRLIAAHGLTALDAIHLATARFVAGTDVMAFVTFDRRLRKAAAAEGFVVLPEAA